MNFLYIQIFVVVAVLKFLGCNQIEMGPFTKANDVVLIFGNKVLPIKYHQCPIKHHPSNITHQISPIKRIFHHKLLPFVLFPLLLCWPSKSAISYQLSMTSDKNLLFFTSPFSVLMGYETSFCCALPLQQSLEVKINQPRQVPFCLSVPRIPSGPNSQQKLRGRGGFCYVILPCRRQTKLKPKMRRICPEQTFAILAD